MEWELNCMSYYILFHFFILLHRRFSYQITMVIVCPNIVIWCASEQRSIDLCISLNYYRITWALCLISFTNSSEIGSSHPEAVIKPKCYWNSDTRSLCIFEQTFIYIPLIFFVKSPFPWSIKHIYESLSPNMLLSLMLADPQIATISSIIINFVWI